MYLRVHYIADLLGHARLAHQSNMLRYFRTLSLSVALQENTKLQLHCGRRRSDGIDGRLRGNELQETSFKPFYRLLSDSFDLQEIVSQQCQ